MASLSSAQINAHFNGLNSSLSSIDGFDSGHPIVPPTRHEMVGLVKSHDWSATPVGPYDRWPTHLKSATDIVLNSAFPMFIWWQSEHLTHIYNDAFIPILGDRHPAALGASGKDLWREVWQEISPLTDQVFTTGQPVYRRELKLRLKRPGQTSSRSLANPELPDQADEAYFTFSYSPIRADNASQVDGLLCIVSETTDEVIARQKLVSLNFAKDEFISLASHQLRTPATGVKQYLGMLLGDFAGSLTPAQREFVQHAYDSNERQLSTVSDLLSVAQAEAGRIDLHYRPTDIVSMIYGILDEQSAKFVERKQTVSFDHSQPDCSISIDQDRMRMVLENLVDNASKYTETGKKIQLSLNVTQQHKSSHPCIDIVIKDQGVGIAKADLETIFDKFTRVDNALSEQVGGSGIGLYLAQKIVKLHGGELTVVSTPGKGSTFRVKLPVRDSEPNPSS